MNTISLITVHFFRKKCQEKLELQKQRKEATENIGP